MKKLGLVATAFLLAVTAVSVVWVVTRPSVDDAEPLAPTTESAPAGLEAFYSQEIEWVECDNAWCANVEVPIDYSQPDNGSAELRMRRVPARDGDGEVLFVNPGGPGGSAQNFAMSFADITSAEVRDKYDIIGVDPRGVGDSTPLRCLDDDRFDAWVATDPIPDDASDLQNLIGSVIEMGDACLSNSGALAAHVSTADVVRDHDIVRAVLGQEKMNWFGASYGTQIGATYADMFPDKVGVMVLDGAVDVTLDEIELSLGQAVGFERALVAYIDDCLENDCPFGDSEAEVRDALDRAITQAEKDPLEYFDGRSLTTGWFFYGLILPLYSEGNWPALTEGLSDVLDGDPSMMFRLADVYMDRDADGNYRRNSGQVIYAVNCLDESERSAIDFETWNDEVVPRFTRASKVFGPILAWGTVACPSWPMPPVTPQQPVEAVGAAPIVVVGTTRDSATPYEWAQAMAEHLESGVLVTREGDGHTAYAAGNTCIREAIDAYLVDGTVPSDGLVCT